MAALSPNQPGPARADRYEVAGRTVALAIVEHPRARRLTLRVQPGDRGIKVTVPPGIGRREVDRFLDRHRGWLADRIAAQPDRPQVRAGIKLPVCGVNHLIVHRPGRGLTETTRGHAGPELIVRGGADHLPRRVADFLKARARQEIEPLVARHAATVGRKVASIRYRDTVSRWGSCSSAGHLSFCWRIAMAPPAVIDYLVAHEVAHLRHMNHGPRFWALCEELCPDTNRCKAWLKRNGGKLQAIVF
ncbi:MULTISPECIES: M48 family metallopeptidase [unclassified Roseitalea]|uniref:M48 family metallopeptidase n=1 Tax=unclassified Roseitalea TaxID=2639107 RepID=UPI00273E5C3D|nr:MULTISPECIES: M48 family metallopeptidase [unclassified Roseitalea]